MTTAYTLRTSRILKSGKHPIMIRIYAGGSQTQISSGYSVHLDDWDPERNAPLELKRTSKRKTSLDNIATNLRLTVARLTEKAEELQSALPGFTAKQLVQYDKGELKVKAGKMKQQSFLDWIHDHLETFDKVTMSGTARVGRTSTKMKYLSQLRVLKQFSEETGEALTWENMDADFCKKMRKWRVSKPAGFMGKGGSSQQRVSIGTVNKWVKTVKLWIAKARDMGVHTYDHHRHPEWTVREGEILRFALSAQQLKDFFAYEIPPGTRGDTSRKGLKRCRDLFVVQCCTGVRISAVSPGPIETSFILGDLEHVADITFSQTMCTAEDVADMVLASARDGKREREFPVVGAKLATLAYLFPSLRRVLRPALEAKGRRTKQALMEKLR